MTISCNKLYVAYQKRTVLRDVTIEIPEGRLIGIIGPNGGGKTTFLKVITKRLKPTSGTIVINTKKKWATGYLPQKIAYDSKFPITTKEVVLSSQAKKSGWFGYYPKTILRQADELLDLLKLSKYHATPFGDLSLGLAQRVLFAMILLKDPEIILLDEPTASVDEEAKNIILNVIEKLKGSKTILMVTHDPTTLRIADEILYIDNSIKPVSKKQICTHFSMGLYHEPVDPKEIK